jgi:hypothetical protein
MTTENIVCANKFPSLDQFFRHQQGRGSATNIPNVQHPATHLLRHISSRGAPVVIQTSPWPARKQPQSVKKLLQGNASWSALKKVLGWLIDTVAMTTRLPPRRLQRLAELLASIPVTQSRLSLDRWHKILGELRSMSLAPPGTRGLFSSLQAALLSTDSKRLRLTKSFHDASSDFEWIRKDLANQPTRMQELVPAAPTLVGAHDNSGLGASGVWFPDESDIPRRSRGPDPLGATALPLGAPFHGASSSPRTFTTVS